MNKIYKVIYNKSKGCYTVVSELAKGKTKSQSRKTKTALTMAVVLGLSVGFMGTTFADGINISQTNNDGTVQQGNTVSGTNKILVGTTIEPHSTSANSETGSIAIGDKIAYGGERSIAIGTDLKTSNDNSILIGSDMIGDAYSKQVIAIGNKIGNKDENNGTYNLGDTQRLIAIGNDVITAPLTSMENFNSVIIGNNSKVTGNNNIVLGNKSSDEKLMEQTTKHDNEDENADPEDATIFILPNGSGFGGADLKKKTGDGYLVIGNEDSSRRIAYVAAGVDDSDAANMEQLRSLAKNKISLGGDTGQTTKLELGVENLTAPNENRLKFNLTGDGNYISTAAGGTSVSTSFKTDQFVADQLPVTFVNADGKKLVKMKVTNGGTTTEGFYVIDGLVDGKVSAGTDPVAPSDVFLSLANPDSGNKAGDPVKLLNLKSILALSNMPTTMSNAAAFSSDNVRVVRNMLTGAQEQGITPDPNQTPFYNISGSDLYRPVTVGDLQAIASAGITFKATSGDEVVRRLGETLTIKGGGKVFNTDFSAKNITTKTENNELIIGLKTAPDFKKITFHDGKASISNDSESNPTQFIFQGAQQADGTYSKMKLTNLADANIVANNSDAVTGGQIFSSLKTVSSDVIAIKANNANGQAVTPKMWLDGNTATNVFLTLNDRSITETKLADAAVTKDKIANGAVTTNKIADNSIPIGKLNTTLQTTINSIGNKLDASRAQFTISDSKTNSTINLNEETAPTIIVKSGNTSALQVALDNTNNTFTITPQTYTGDLTWTLNTANGKKLVTATTVKTALDTKLDTSKALFKIQDDTTTQKSMSLNTTTPPVVRVKGDSSVIEVNFDNNDLKVSAKVADTTAANFVNSTNQNLLATPLGVKNYIDSLKAPVAANDFGNTNNGGKLATAQGVVNYVNANKVKYFSVNTTQDWMGNPHNDGNANNDGARGENSLVIGRASSTQRQGSLFVGNGITDSGLGNGGSWTGFNGGFVTVVGNNNTIQRPQSMFPQVEEMGITVLGSMNNIIGRTTKVFGFNNNILGPANLGIGDNLTVNGTKGENVAIIMTSMNLNNGPSADREQGISGDGNVGIGSGVLITSKSGQNNSYPVKAVAIGYDTKVYAVDSIAIGRQALGEAQGGIALGSDARTTKQGATYNSEMIKTGYNPGNTAAPSNNNTWQANRSELSLGQYDGSTGQSSITRRIANVAAGVLDADAVNVAQLKQITLGVQDDNATTTNKLYMKLYDDTNKKVNLLNMVSDTDKNVKVTVVPGENKVKFGLKPDLKGITSITNTADGSTFTTGTTLTIGDAGLTLNSKKITGLQAGDISTTSNDAINGSQLNNTINKVENKIDSVNNFAYVNATGDELVKDGNNFYKKSDLTNLARANDGKYYNKTDVNPDGSLKNTNPAPTPVAVQTQTADYISIINPDGTTTKATAMGNAKSALGLDNMPDTLAGTPITAAKAKEVVAGTDGASGLLTKTGKDLYKVATVGDLQAVSMAGLTFTADETNKEIHRPLGTALKISATNSITATNTADFTTTNLGTKIDTTNNTISIEMKKTLTDINSITSTTGTDLVLKKGGTDKPSITINDDGLKVTTGTGTTQSNIVIGKDGKISGIKPATISSTSNEVVIGSQLQDLKDNLKFQVENIKPTMVYTDANGDRLIKDGDNFYKASAVEKDYALANDGKYYPKDKVDQYGNVTDNTSQAVNLQDVITGAGDKVDSSNVIISTVNPDGTTTSSTIIGNVKSGLGLENMNKTATGGTISTTDKQNGSGSTTITAGDARTSIAGTNKDGKGGIYNLSGNALHKVATVGDLQAVSMAGLTFTADETSKEIHRPLGTALKISATNSITATNTADFTTTNLGTKIDTTNNVISIEMKKALTDINSITSTADTDLVLKKGGTDKPSIKISDDGLTVTMPNPAGATTTINPIIIGKDGKITGLANGTADTDAVNVSQLNNKADKDGSNLVNNTAGTPKTSALNSTAQSNWATALGTGTIGSGDTANGGKATDNNLVTGKTVHEALKDMVKYDSDKHDTITLGIPAGQTGATTTKITNLTDGDITNTSTDAVTGKQIKAIVDNVNTTINNLTSTMVYTDAEGNKLTKVGDKFYKTSALSNYALANDGKYYEKSKVNTVTGAVENGATEVDLAATVPATDQVAVDKVITSAVNGSGSTTSAQTIGNIASGLGLDNMKVLDNGTQSNTSSTTITQDKAAKVIAGDNKDGKGGLLTKSGVELHKVATVGDLQAVSMAGLTFTADETNKEIHRPLGTALKIVTGTAIIENPKAPATADPNKPANEDKFTNANLGTKIDSTDNVIGIQMKKDLTDINSITSTTGTDLVLKKGGTDKPSITITDDGLKVTTGKDATKKEITIGKDGKITGLADGTIAKNSTDAVTGNQIASLTVGYKSSTAADTDKKTVTLTDGFDFKAGTGTTGTTNAGTDTEKAKKGIVIETKDNGEIVIGLDEETRKKIDATMDEVVVVDGDNTTAVEDTDNQEAGKKKYKVNINKDLNNINSITSEKDNDLTLSRKDGSKVVLEDNAINLTAGSGTDAKTITINKDGTISGVSSGLKLDNTTPIDKAGATAALNGIEDKANPANNKPGLLGTTGDALNNIATIKDLQAVAQGGLTFKSDGGEEIHRPLGSALSLTTGIKVNDANKTAYEFANPNLGTVVNPANGTINFVFKSQPTFNGISFSGGPAGNVLNMNNAGQLFITKDGKDELLGINVKKFDGKSYFVPLNGTIEFKDTANVVADVTGKTESTLAPAGLAGGTGGTPSVASPTSGPAPLSTGSAFFDGVDTTTDAKPPASTTVDATVEWKIPDNAPIKITVDENNMKDDQIVNKKYVDSKLAPIVNNTTNITNHLNKLGEKIVEVSRDSNAGTASALAAASIPQVLNVERRSLVGFGMGSYRGSRSFALGLSGTNRARDFVYKITGTYDSRNVMGLSVGIGFSVGPKNHYEEDKEKNYLEKVKVNDFNERLMRQQAEIETLKDFIKEMQVKHEAEMEALKEQMKNMQPK